MVEGQKHIETLNRQVKARREAMEMQVDQQRQQMMVNKHTITDFMSMSHVLMKECQKIFSNLKHEVKF